MDDEYLIWSNEGGCWWKANSCGYTGATEQAGRYTREEALKICCFGRDGWKRAGQPPEIPVRASDVEYIEEMQKQRSATREAKMAELGITEQDVHETMPESIHS